MSDEHKCRSWTLRVEYFKFIKRNHMGDCSTVFVPRKPKPADHNHIKFSYFFNIFLSPARWAYKYFTSSFSCFTIAFGKRGKQKQIELVCLLLPQSLDFFFALFFLCYFKLETEQNELPRPVRCKLHVTSTTFRARAWTCICTEHTLQNRK